MNPRTRALWPIVALREMRVRLTDRNFLISTGFTLVFLVGMMAFQGWLAGHEGEGTSYDVAVVDDRGAQVAEIAGQQLAAMSDGETIRAEKVADADAARRGVEESEVALALLPTEDGWEVLSDGYQQTSPLVMTIQQAAQAEAMQTNAAAAGTSLPELMKGGTVTVTDLTAPAEGEEGVAEAAGPMAFLLPLFFAMMFYMAALMFGMAIAQSVVEEKQSRIIEILTAAVPIRQLLAGKILGNTALALLQVALIAAAVIFGTRFIDMGDLELDFGGLTEAILWYIPFFVLGFLAIACIWAAAGALASRNEDLQATTMPLTMVLVAILLVGMSLEGTARVIGSYVPVLSTIMMPTRIVEGDAAWWEPIVSLLVVLAFCALTLTFGAKLYRRTVLHTSGTLTWRKALSLKD